jgi:hypothetical protein
MTPTSGAGLVKLIIGNSSALLMMAKVDLAQNILTVSLKYLQGGGGIHWILSSW